MRKLISIVSVICLCFQFNAQTFGQTFGQNIKIVEQSVLTVKTLEKVEYTIIKDYALHGDNPRYEEAQFKYSDFPMPIENGSRQILNIKSPVILAYRVETFNTDGTLKTLITYSGKRVSIPYIMRNQRMLVTIYTP